MADNVGRDRFAKAVQIVFEIGRQFLFQILLSKKGTMEAIRMLILAIRWEREDRRKVHVILESGRAITADDFDISMLYHIIRKGKILDRPEVPRLGWGREPEAHSVCLGDDIERLQKFKVQLTHSGTASMEQNDFDLLVSEVKQILHRWYSMCGTLYVDVDREYIVVSE